MNPINLKSFEWVYKKGVAQLTDGRSVLISIKFGGKASEITIRNRTVQLKKIGFWRPELVIVDRGNKLLHLTRLGFWGCTYDVRIGNRSYSGKSRVTSHYRVSFMNNYGKEVLSYDLNSWKWKAKAEFLINENAAPLDDILLLLIAGYLTIRRLKYESEGSVALVAAAG